MKNTATILVIAFSVIVVLLVSLMYSGLGIEADTGFDINILAKVNAIINSLVSALLLLGLIFIRKKKIAQHKASMLAAIILSGLFLIVYVVYHALKGGSTSYGGEGVMRYLYFFFLLTHVVLAAVSLPFILLTAWRALKGDIQKHKKMARYVWPVWFYVAITGVIVYIMISPYY